jgi:hypothetical protein
VIEYLNQHKNRFLFATLARRRRKKGDKGRGFQFDREANCDVTCV